MPEPAPQFESSPDAFERHFERVDAMVKEQKLRSDPAYQAEQERAKAGTKPLWYTDTSIPGRPITVVGGGGMYYEDMKDTAKRLAEKPNPSSELEKRDPKADLDIAVDRQKRANRGAKSFFFSNNPLAK